MFALIHDYFDLLLTNLASVEFCHHGLPKTELFCLLIVPNRRSAKGERIHPFSEAETQIPDTKTRSQITTSHHILNILSLMLMFLRALSTWPEKSLRKA